MSTTDRPVPVAPPIASRHRSRRCRETYRAKLTLFCLNSRCNWRAEMPSAAATLAGVRGWVCEMQIDVALDRREARRVQRIPSLIDALVGSATAQCHEAAKVAKHRFAEYIRKERYLGLRRIDSCAEQRAERRRAGQPKGALAAPRL